jgi:hypothetical protein
MVKKWLKYLAYICNFQKLPKVNNHPIGENSPNLFTLISARECCSSFMQSYFKGVEPFSEQITSFGKPARNKFNKIIHRRRK